MKKLFFWANLIIAVLFSFTSCNTPNDPHQHTFSTEWQSDTTSHWHEATCGHSDAEKKELHNLEVIDTKEATCIEPGSRLFECICGYKTTETISAIGHYFGEYISDENSTTETDGTKTRTCSVCNTQETVIDEGSIIHNHFWENGTITTKPKCTEPGIKTFYCICGETFSEVVPARGHEFGDFISDENATLKNDGTKTRRCTICNAPETITDEGSKIHLHSYDTTWSGNEVFHWHSANCSHESYISDFDAHSFENWYCTVCNRPMHFWECTKTVDSNAKTIKYDYTCRDCNYICNHSNLKTIQINKFLPQYSDTPMKVMVDGFHWYYIEEPATEKICQDCGQLIEGYYPSDTQIVCGHVDYEFNRNADYFYPATCSKCGFHCDHTDVLNSKCQSCLRTCPHKSGFTRTNGEMSCKMCDFICENHNFTSDGYCSICRQTCTHEWNTSTHKCKICGKACVHNYEDGSSTCTYCSYHYHTYSDIWTVTENSHWHAGNCGHSELQKDFSSHSWGTGSVTKAATEFETGIRTFTCKCGKQKTESIPLLDHSFSAYLSYDDTYHMYKATCAHKDLVKDKAEHELIDGFCNTCGYTVHHFEKTTTRIDQTLFHTYTCSHCDFVCPHEETYSFDVKGMYLPQGAMAPQVPAFGTYVSEKGTYIRCRKCSLRISETYPKYALVCPQDGHRKTYNDKYIQCGACGYRHTHEDWINGKCGSCQYECTHSTGFAADSVDNVMRCRNCNKEEE